MTNVHRYMIIAFALGIGTVFATPSSAKTYHLEECIRLAKENNSKLKTKRLEVQKAKEIKKNAFTAYFPKVDAAAFAMRANKGLIEADIPQMDLPVYDGNPASLQAPTQFTYFPGMSLELLDEANIVAITAVQPLYAGGRIVNGNRLAALGVDISQQQLALEEKEIVAATEMYFWTIISLQEKKKTIASYEKLLQNLQKDVNTAFEAGLVHKSDVLKVQLKLNEVKTNRLKLENGLSLLKQNMAIHIGVPYDRKMAFRSEIGRIAPPEQVFRNKSEALNLRTERHLLSRVVEAEQLQKKMARGELLPEVFVGATAYGLDAFDQKTARGILFAGVKVPISAWWGGYHKLQEHNARIEIAKNQLSETEALLQLQMEKTYNELTEAYEQIQLARQTVSQAQEHLKMVKDNFDAGVMSTSDMLEAEALYQQALDALVDMETGYKIKMSNYLKATAQ